MADITIEIIGTTVQVVSVNLESDSITTTMDLGTFGLQGPIGLQGIQGIQGLKGEAGNDGKDGVDGTNGLDGLTTSVNGVTHVNGDVSINASDIPYTNTESNLTATEVQSAIDELQTIKKTYIKQTITPQKWEGCGTNLWFNIKADADAYLAEFSDTMPAETSCCVYDNEDGTYNSLWQLPPITLSPWNPVREPTYTFTTVDEFNAFTGWIVDDTAYITETDAYWQYTADTTFIPWNPVATPTYIFADNSEFAAHTGWKRNETCYVTFDDLYYIARQEWSFALPTDPLHKGNIIPYPEGVDELQVDVADIYNSGVPHPVIIGLTTMVANTTARIVQTNSADNFIIYPLIVGLYADSRGNFNIVEPPYAPYGGLLLFGGRSENGAVIDIAFDGTSFSIAEPQMWARPENVGLRFDGEHQALHGDGTPKQGYGYPIPRYWWDSVKRLLSDVVDTSYLSPPQKVDDLHRHAPIPSVEICQSADYSITDSMWSDGRLIHLLSGTTTLPSDSSLGYSFLFTGQDNASHVFTSGIPIYWNGVPEDPSTSCTVGSLQYTTLRVTFSIDKWIIEG